MTALTGAGAAVETAADDGVRRNGTAGTVVGRTMTIGGIVSAARATATIIIMVVVVGVEMGGGRRRRHVAAGSEGEGTRNAAGMEVVIGGPVGRGAGVGAEKERVRGVGAGIGTGGGDMCLWRFVYFCCFLFVVLSKVQK